MIDKHQEANILRSLAETYQEMIEAKEQNAGKLGKDNLRKAQGAHRPVGGGGAGFFGKAAGMGKDKAIKNHPSADDRRAQKQKKQAANDRNDERSVSPSERKERARNNKENKAKAGIDDLLKSIRGK